MLKAIIAFFEEISKCQTAAHLTRSGRHDLARELMLGKTVE